ncbi:mucin-5AC-like isoform X2 [Varroa jacobsoni]|nr:mucin-5AC-like isoform X2 [Varroa jacobsoni]XP_022689715.1 mucin-5AC-like isoform X2 [Varroa jacobsoni]XP_022689716.1 mucin-5AC-like isoform X2 [Varroa jacobsoni]
MGEPDKPLTRFDEIRENPAELSEKEWRDRLTPDQFYVCRQRGTEPAYVGRYVKFDKKGTYHCMACDAFLFKSEHKYPSNCGWPSFFAARPGDVKQRTGGRDDNSEAGQETVKRREDNSLGMTRVEVSCRLCNSHLGHVFPDGPLPTKERFCINSMAINFRKAQPPTSSCVYTTTSRLTPSSARQRTQSPAAPQTDNNSTPSTTTAATAATTSMATAAAVTPVSSSGSSGKGTFASNIASSRSSSASHSRDSSAHRNRDDSSHQRSSVTPLAMSTCCGPLSLTSMTRCLSATTTTKTMTKCPLKTSSIISRSAKEQNLSPAESPKKAASAANKQTGKMHSKKATTTKVNTTASTEGTVHATSKGNPSRNVDKAASLKVEISSCCRRALETSAAVSGCKMEKSGDK